MSDALLEKEKDVGTSSPPAPRAYVTWALIALNLLVFGLMVLGGVPPWKPPMSVLLPWGANFGPLILAGGWWRLLAPVFLHAGFIHLLLNMAVLANIGPAMEKLLGRLPYLTLYLVAGIRGCVRVQAGRAHRPGSHTPSTGNAAALAWQPFMVGVGASGAILGLYGALLAVLLCYRHAVPAQVWARFRKGISVLITVVVGFSLAGQLFHPETATPVHLGGLVSGFLLGLFLARPLRRGAVAEPPHKRNLVAGTCGAALATAVMLVFAKPIGQAAKGLGYFIRGAAEAQKGDLNAALADYYDHVIRLDPKNALAYISRGNLKVRKGDLDGAIADYDRALQLGVTDAIQFGVTGD